MASVVLDASALIALFRDEPGADMVATFAGDAVLSTVNLQEVVKALLRRGVPLTIIREMIDALHLDIRPHSAEDAFAAAALHEVTEQFGTGLGDRSCIALAISVGLPAMTTDRVWAELKIPGFTVKLAR